MGCDIHSVAIDADGHPIPGGVWADGKTRNPDHEWLDDEGEPFGPRHYGVFGFLADVRNYSDIPPISEPRGTPDDFHYAEDDWLGYHSFSWLSVDELESFNYDDEIIDHRQGAQLTTWREFLGDDYFHDLAELRRIGADRVVFGFDN